MRHLRRTSQALLSLSTLLALASPALAAPYFQHVDGAFPSPQPCGPNEVGCWTNYLRVTDIDNDGDLDVLLPNAAGFGNSKGASQPFVVYRNDGNFKFSDASAAVGGGDSGWLRQVAVGDVTGDGFVDIYAPDAWGGPDKFFINDGTGKFTDQSQDRLPGVMSHAGFTRFGDIDNDGDLDLFVGDGYSGNSGKLAHLYLNDGTGKFSEAPWDLPTQASGQQPIDVDLFDADGDFDLDVFIDMHFGQKGSLWINDGTGKFTDATGTFPPQQGGLNRYDPVACDVDGDGDLDLWQDNAVAPGGLEQLLINDGTGKFTDETASRVTGNPASDDNGVTCIDIDGDGDMDAVITTLGDHERLLVNDGTGKFAYQPDAFPSFNQSSLWLEFGDLNGDGKLDMVTAEGESSFPDEVFSATDTAPADKVAPRIRATQAVGNVTADDTPVFRFAVSDSHTTDEGPRLKKAYVKITAPAAAEVPAKFMGGDLFRVVLPKQPGGSTVTFEACATDPQGNDGCSKPISYMVAGMPTGGAGGASGGAGGAGGANGGAGGANGGAGGASGGAGGSDTTSGTGGDFNLNNKGGCGCAIPGADPESGALALGIAGLLLGIGRRRRARR
jgi:MYXO-CTERM domain-containing protein